MLSAAPAPPSETDANAKDAAHGLSVLSQAMKDDPSFAWAWHCNIAMVARDAGAPAYEANVRTADFMRHAFGVDTDDGTFDKYKTAPG